MAVDDRGRELGWYAWPEVRVLADAGGAWRWLPLPDLVLGLHRARVAAPKRVPSAALPGGPDSEPELEAHVPAEVQEHLRRDAPRSWQALLQGTQLLQRGEAYRIAIQRGALSIEHRPSGAGTPQRLSSELLELASSLGAGEHSSRAEAVLLTELLRARWLHRRLPPGLRWAPDERSFALRSQPEIRVGERLDPRGVPLALELAGGEEGPSRTLPCSPGEGLPIGVVRAALEWLFGGPRESEELYLDPRGVLPREPLQGP